MKLLQYEVMTEAMHPEEKPVTAVRETAHGRGDTRGSLGQLRPRGAAAPATRHRQARLG